MFNVSSRRFYKPEWSDSEHPDYSIAEWAQVDNGCAGDDLRQRRLERGNVREPVRRSGTLGNVGRADLRLLADKVRRGTLDLVGVGRTHIANNDFVNKVRARRFTMASVQQDDPSRGGAMEALEPGFVEEGRKNDAAD